MFVIYLSLGILVILAIAMLVTGKENVKLKCRNRLLCRENHKLRIKLKEYENSTKGI
jgi:hypothetical protein